MTHGSLFSGIGGFDLAAEWMGWENVFHCEINEFCRKVLHKHWPHVKTYTDITATDFSEHRGRIDVLTGGFPCQPFSTAGKQKGTADNRYLWPAMLAAITAIQPRWVVGENVPGLVNWSRGLVFEQVQADLAAAGYSTFPCILPAAAVGAPHKRERVWFVAYACKNAIKWTDRQNGLDLDERILQKEKWEENAIGCWSSAQQEWIDFATRFCRMDDGIPNRVDRIAALGNAIVPQVALQIFRTIEEFERQSAPR